jgi:hypothetical protein
VYVGVDSSASSPVSQHFGTAIAKMK